MVPSVWSDHLTQFTRHFVVNGEASPAIQACTGFLEGCPLACAAMSAIDMLGIGGSMWSLRNLCASAMLITSSFLVIPPTLCKLLLRGFSPFVPISTWIWIFWPCMPGPSGRREVKSLGYNASVGARDLGGLVTYCKQLRNRVLTDRFAQNFYSGKAA